MKNIIIMAVKEEAPKMARWDNVFFSGVGKVNAAILTASLVERYIDTIETVWNFGTAGGITVSKGLHNVGTFIQRDMRCEPLGFERGRTPFEEGIALIENYHGLCCATSDSFITTKDIMTTESNINLVDMEAYAILKAIRTRGNRGIKFHCYKYITDNADESASKEWQENIDLGEKYYIKKYEEFLNK